MKIGSEIKFRIFAFIFYLVLACFSLRSFIFEGRFWAEDGVFYADLTGKSFLQVLTYIFNGHLELFTNLVIYLSTLVELRYAPLVSTLISFAFQSLPFFILIMKRKELNLSRRAVVLFIILVLGAPGAAEVAANCVNLHFHFTLLAIIILLLPVTKLNNLLLFMSGLSGIPANALVPFYLFVTIRECDRKRLFQFFILTITAALQIFLLINNQAEIQGRNFDFGLLMTAQIFVNQELILPLLPRQLAVGVLKVLRSASDGSLGGWLLLAGFVLIFLSIVIKAFKGSYKERFLIALNLYLGLFFIVSSHYQSLELIHETAGGRYFYSVYATLVLILLHWLDLYRSKFLKLVFLTLTLVALSRIYFYPFNGPLWSEAYESGKISQAYEIWPKGWNIQLKGH